MTIEAQLEGALAQAPLVLAIYDGGTNTTDEVTEAATRVATNVIAFYPAEAMLGGLRTKTVDELIADDRLVVGVVEQLDPDLPALRDELVERSHRVVRISAPEVDAVVRERHLAGYHADTDAGVDRLGISPDVEMLADLVASRLIKPPLSIGLFGNWGSGKSFFMRQMRERVRSLAHAAAAEEKARKERGRDVSSYCSAVRQITFNAWHYAEANLWASLAAHIFDNLAVGGSEDALERRADHLAELRQQDKSLLTQLSAARLERMMVAARYEREPFTLDLTHDDFAWVGKVLDVPEATIDNVREFATGMLGWKAKARQVLSLFRRSKLAWVLLGAGVALTVGIVALLRSPLWPAITAMVSTAVATVTPFVREVHKAVTRIKSAAETKEAAAGKRLADLDAETERLERAISELAPGHGVTAFAKSRHASADYRQHLGVVSLLRRDLETFAAILDKEREADGGLERIVLYIDDLDRCPPDVVVKVLEAIHLLVALPVFVVVVGVDARWLRRAITRHYAEMLPDEVLTPADYLEKIFQVPFQLSSMDSDGFEDLVRTLAGTEKAPGVAVAWERPANETPVPVQSAVVVPARISDLRPRQLDISEAELDFLSRLAPLVPSPRAAKRLVNLYRLLRARLSGPELDAFVSGHGSGAVLVLLAVHAGEGNEADGLFKRIEAAGSGLTSWRGLLDRYQEDDDVEALCERLVRIDGMPDELDVYREWLPLVRRFSFGH
ncbi:MAG: P-loop NTPase fold protein [Actinophytocola sp.]